MNRWLKPLLGLFLAALVAGCGAPAAAPAGGSAGAAGAKSEAGYAHPELLAETAWLNAHLQDAAVRVLDVRKKEAYSAEHIPGAIWYDPALLKDPGDKLHVIGPAPFAQAMTTAGVGERTTVVAYDDLGGLSAARLWWVLGYYGHQDTKILNGGWQKWQKEGLPLSQDVPSVQPAEFKAKPDPGLICSTEELQQDLADAGVVVLDARSPAEYQGADVRAARGGHVPGAVNVEWTRALSTSEPRVWRSAAELRDLYQKAGIGPDQEVITYCQTGVRAAHSLFTLRLIGYGQVRNYDGSWAEWGNSPTTPIER